MDHRDPEIRRAGPEAGNPPAVSGQPADPVHPPPTVDHPEDRFGLVTDTGPGDGPTGSFRRHPARWTLAAGGLAMVLALGGYGVTRANATTGSSASAGKAAGPSRPPGHSGSAPSGSSPSGGAPPPGAGGGPGALAADRGRVGKVTSVGGGSITLAAPNGTEVSVIVTSSTVFKRGAAVSTSSALKKGDLAMVTGSTSSDGTVTAATVTFGTAPRGGPGAAPPSEMPS